MKGWGGGSKMPPIAWPPLPQETSNNINGVFTPPTSCSPSQPFNHTASHPAPQYSNKTHPQPHLIRPFAKDRFQGQILWSSPQCGKTISTPGSHGVSVLNPAGKQKSPLHCFTETGGSMPMETRRAM